MLVLGSTVIQQDLEGLDDADGYVVPRARLNETEWARLHELKLFIVRLTHLIAVTFFSFH